MHLPPLHPHPFHHGPLRLELLAAPVLDDLVTDRTDPDRLPYWAVIWESAVALARWLAEHPPLPETPVLELGCGAGLAGLAAATLGARVTQTDLFPEAVYLALQNAARNGLETSAFVADWRAWPLSGRWPLILGSDLLYERSSHADLLHVLDRALLPGGTVRLTDPLRAMSHDFLRRAREAGWHVEQEPLAVSETGTPLWLLTLTR